MVFKLDMNYFTGPLPSFIGNLSQLTYLSVSHNALSGTIPKELGNLKELLMLSIGSNNFSGTLPPEIGNLVKLQQIYIDSSGVAGEIPSTFAKLQDMKVMYATDVLITGKIPDFIGDWTKLESLRIGDLENVSSSLDFIKEMKNLTDLVLRNSLISGSIPAYIGQFQSLKTLDLSFNNLTGEIPDALFNLSSLTSLFLGTNRLSGTFPAEKSEQLQTIQITNTKVIRAASPPLIPAPTKIPQRDLSYNELSGSFPPWLKSGLQLQARCSILKQWQEGDTGKHKKSSEIVSSQRIQMTATDDWFKHMYLAMMVMGVVMVLKLNLLSLARLGSNCLYMEKGKALKRGTSALGIKKKPKATEGWSLQILQGCFKEYKPRNLVANNLTFDSTNRSKCYQDVYLFIHHHFNLYIKNVTRDDTNVSIKCGGPEWKAPDGTIYEADNSITTNAASTSYYVSKLENWGFSNVGLYGDRVAYKTNKTENGNYTVSLQFAEMVLKDPSAQTWESTGRRVFDIYIQGTLQLKDFDITEVAGGVERAIERKFNVVVSQNYLEIHLFWAGKGTCCIPFEGYYGPSISALSVVSDLERIPPTTSPKKGNTGLIVGITVAVGILSFILICAVFYVKWKTSNLNEEIGCYFLGTLPDGRIVAVKELTVASQHAKTQFITEITTISAVQHRNLVKLYGFCIKGNKRLLVYEYLENGSLDHALFGKRDLHLDWPTRFNICLATARALAYLHEESRPRIVHRDVKASNILLDEYLCPKISDFGLAKLYDDKKTHISTGIAGTIGYLAPEYAMRGHLTEKADVFGFGVVALEILCGRPNTDNSLDAKMIYLLEWAWALHENNRSLDLIDPRLIEFNENEAIRVVGVAFLCTQASPMLRPTMSRVVAMLAGDIEVSTITSKPSYLTDWDFNDTTSGFLTEDTQTSFTSNESPNNPTSCASNKSASNPTPSPVNISGPMLHGIVGD
ncbi:hypothetical protein AAG906_039328 [Vitis piasezkii]